MAFKNHDDLFFSCNVGYCGIFRLQNWRPGCAVASYSFSVSFFLDVLICLKNYSVFSDLYVNISDQKPQQPGRLGSFECYYISIERWYFLDYTVLFDFLWSNFVPIHCTEMTLCRCFTFSPTKYESVHIADMWKHIHKHSRATRLMAVC